MGTMSAAPKSVRARVGADLTTLAAVAGAALAVLGSGAAISSVLPSPASPWLFAGAYAAPGAIAFAVYWWIAQRA
jgi:hypothetical protein